MKTRSDILFISVFAGLLFITLSSCGGREAYSFHHIKNGKWHRDSLLVFMTDSLTPVAGKEYKVSIELASNRSYPYRDLWLQIDQDLTDSLVHSDTLRCLLADEHGKWLGGSAGGLNQLSIPYRSFFTRDSVYRYKVVIRHIMDDERLGGVEKVGVKLVME